LDLSTLEHREQGVEIEPEDVGMINRFRLLIPDDEWQKPHDGIHEFMLGESDGSRFGVTLEDYIDALSGEPEAEWLWSRVDQMKKFLEAVVGSRGDAGEKIYGFCKEKALK
jgi:hypothetical protein